MRYRTTAASSWKGGTWEYHGYTVPQHWLADLDAIPDGATGEPQSGYLVGADSPTPEEKALLRKLSDELGHRRD